MENQIIEFNEQMTLGRLKHYLPAQAPLKDFVHHNTLHAFQKEEFHKGITKAAQIFGFQVYLTLSEYRNLYTSNKINDNILNQIIVENTKDRNLTQWRNRLIHKEYDALNNQRIGVIRNRWKSVYKINLDKKVHPVLFRLVGAYLDQGISIVKFPNNGKGLLSSVRELEKNSFVKIFQSKRASKLLFHETITLEYLLKIVVGETRFYEQYLFDQQFGHPGWSGMVSVLECNSSTLLDPRKISLEEFIILELLLEIDTLDNRFNETWKPVGLDLESSIPQLFDEPTTIELFEVYKIWHESYEWTFYDEVLKGLQTQNEILPNDNPSFQAVFCIDDRECSFRRYLEQNDSLCETYGTAGFFNVAFYFQPEHGKFHTKVCPAPLSPKHLVKEYEAGIRHKKHAHFNKNTHGLVKGWISSPAMGLLSMLKLARSILYPSQNDMMISSFDHMDKNGRLSIENRPDAPKSGSFQMGFTVEEMVDKVEGLLKSIGLIQNFAPLVYILGHGASSVNNTHYAGYDCGACSGRSGSVNARVAAYMANKAEVRQLLMNRGITIPSETQFVGGLHDTTRDEAEFYDLDTLTDTNTKLHKTNLKIIDVALQENAKERSRRFGLINTRKNTKTIHEEVKLRSLSLFEPRPEWNHATNALCIVGKRENNKHLFFDRRAFLNSYDYTIDPKGKILSGILNAIAPVCGGINLEYYFSRVDNHRLGAGTKLPHNVMGLIGVANGMDGDLRTGLPKQMINIHDPLRLLVTVEQFPEVVLDTIKANSSTYEWFMNEWIHLVVIHPETRSLFVFRKGEFVPYIPLSETVFKFGDLEQMIEKTSENLPIGLLNQ